MILYKCVYTATSELGQTGVVFLKVNSSRTTGTSQVLATLLLLNFENEIKLVWLGSKAASVNALYMCGIANVSLLFPT